VEDNVDLPSLLEKAPVKSFLVESLNKRIPIQDRYMQDLNEMRMLKVNSLFG
jgi:hypothetical protein